MWYGRWKCYLNAGGGLRDPLLFCYRDRQNLTDEITSSVIQCIVVDVSGRWRDLIPVNISNLEEISQKYTTGCLGASLTVGG